MLLSRPRDATTSAAFSLCFEGRFPARPRGLVTAPRGETV